MIELQALTQMPRRMAALQRQLHDFDSSCGSGAAVSDWRRGGWTEHPEGQDLLVSDCTPATVPSRRSRRKLQVRMAKHDTPEELKQSVQKLTGISADMQRIELQNYKSLVRGSKSAH